MPGPGSTGRVNPSALSIAEAAAQLGVHRLTLRASIDRGEIRAIRIGRRWLIPVSALDDLLAGRRSTAETER